MADFGVDDQWKIEYKQQFKQEFTTHLTRILALVPNSVVGDGNARDILHELAVAALDQARIYIGDEEPQIYDNELEYFYILLPEARIGGEQCFMQLFREYNNIEDQDVRRELYNIEAQAVDIGVQASKVLLRMMVVVNIEGRENLLKRFGVALSMLSFSKDAFEWPGRSEYYGVVYNRIIVLMKHAHKEFMLQIIKRSRLPVKDFFAEVDYASVDEILYETVEIISKLESYLSFAILPDGPRLLANNGRSLHWLLAELQNLTDGPMMMDALAGRVRRLTLMYRNCEYYSHIETFLNRMYTLKDAMWEDLLSEVTEVQVVKTPLSQLQVKAKIIKQHGNSALIRINGINTREEAKWYIKKRIAYRYKNNVQKKYSHYRCIWGKITRPHGDTGILQAKFKSRLVHAITVRMSVYIGIG